MVTLLLVGSGDQRYREYVLSALSPHYRLWLADSQAPTWQKRYLAGATVTDVTDPRAIVAAAGSAADDAGPVTGVLCYDEWLVEATARAATALGLPGPSADAVTACRDKSATRRLLTAAGVPQPLSMPVQSLDEAREAAETVGYPVVVKARALAGSMGVVRADSPGELPASYEAAAGTSRAFGGQGPCVLVEEYLDGPEISVDSAVRGGGCDILVLARKRTGPAPYFEETGHTVDAADPLLADPELRAALTEVHRALSFDHGVTHCEFRLTVAGPRLVEINARLAGDFIPYLGRLATGVDTARAAADLAAGREPDMRRTRRGASGARFLYPGADCTVKDASVAKVPPLPALHQIIITAVPGQLMLLPPRGYLSRYACVIAAGDSLAQIEETLAKAESLVELETERF